MDFQIVGDKVAGGCVFSGQVTPVP